MKLEPLFFIIVFLHPLEIISSRTENRLYRHVLTNYLKLARPVKNPKDSLNVSMKVFLQQIVNLDGKNQIIEVNAWLKFVWIDYRLSWDPAKYDNITSIRFAGGENQIWRPDVLLYNSANEDFDSTFKSNEVVYHTGEVNWVPPGILRASCKMDITYFPFDDQVCYLKFSSWTYHQWALDLNIITEGDEEQPSMDLSTYTPSGEWHLVKAPAIKEVQYSACCPEPYATVTFYMYLRRRTLFYLFNIIFPSLLVSMMSIMGFCLPAHDMSEKIGFQTTVLLSICFFVTIVSEMTPPTSEAIPSGMFFSTLTLISAISTAFTIMVLNFRYRQVQNIHMHPSFYKVFLVWLPWVLLMKRPGVRYKKRKEESFERDAVYDIDNLESQFDQAGDGDYSYFFTSMESESLPPPLKRSPLLRKMKSIPAEHLDLDRKVGEGILKKLLLKKKKEKQKEKRCAMLEKYIRKCIEDSTQQKTTAYCEYLLTIVEYYRQIDVMLKFLSERLSKQRKHQFEQEDWKFAAMALDRLCLVLVTGFILFYLFWLWMSTPHFEP